MIHLAHAGVRRRTCTRIRPCTYRTCANSSYLSFSRELLSRLTDFIRMQIRGRAPALAQYPRTMARVGLFLRGRPGKSRRWKRTGREMAIPIPHASKEKILRSQKYEAVNYFEGELRLRLLGCPRCLNALARTYQGDGERRMLLEENLGDDIFSFGYFIFLNFYICLNFFFEVYIFVVMRSIIGDRRRETEGFCIEGSSFFYIKFSECYFSFQ